MSTGAPRWIEVRLRCPAEWSELVAERLAEGTGGSVAFGRSSLAADPVPEGLEQVRAFYDERVDSPAFREELAGRIRSLAEPTGDPRLGRATLDFKVLPFEDWANSWRKSWKPYRVGRLAVVTYDWSGTPKDDDVVMRLEPAGAFGTGRHPTTRHCLRFLSDLDLAGKRVLDAGCGSGILSVAAKLLGAATAFGFDIDERSVPDGEELGARNGISSGVEFAHGGFELLDGVAGEYDVVLANIYFDVLADGLDSIRRVLKPRALGAFSGIHERYLDQVLDACGATSLDVKQVWARGRWRTVLVARE